MATQTRIALEPSAQGIVDATSTPPFLYELEPAAARKVLEDLQSGPIDKLPVDEEWITVSAAVGDARVRIIKPAGHTGTLPVILYMHGGGWILGNARTHDRLVRELAVGASAALLFVEYPNSPEARYPVAIEQGYATAQWVIREGAGKGLDAARMAVAGESVGGNMAAALDALDQAAICRAAIESLAENASDGVTAPAFWFLLGGLPGMIVYKAINTADSMIGHMSDRYRAFGWAAARLDDLVNWPASRLTGLIFIAAAAVVPGASAASAWEVFRRDSRLHRSPNAGWPEAAMAGALGLRLAGPVSMTASPWAITGSATEGLKRRWMISAAR